MTQSTELNKVSGSLGQFLCAHANTLRRDHISALRRSLDQITYIESWLRSEEQRSVIEAERQAAADREAELELAVKRHREQFQQAPQVPTFGVKGSPE